MDDDAEMTLFNHFEKMSDAHLDDWLALSPYREAGYLRLLHESYERQVASAKAVFQRERQLALAEQERRRLTKAQR